MKIWIAELLNIEDLTSTVEKFTFSMDLDFKAGQYVTFAIPIGDKITQRSYSLASSPSDNVLEIIVKKVGDGAGTSFLWSMNVGDTVEMVGALGAFTIKDTSQDIVFISTGTGMAPFRSMIDELKANSYSGKIIMLTGYRTEDEELCKEEFLDVDYHCIISQPLTDIEKGRVQILIEKYVPFDFKGDFYLCGLSVMIEETKSFLEAKGFSKIHYEKYD